MDKKSIDLKPTELTGIIGRESMNRLSEIVGPEKWKKYRDCYDKASNLEIETEFPIQLDFELNASCNLRCPMCPLSTESNNNKGRDTWFKFEDFKRILDFGIKHGLCAIKLNYLNEPLIRDDIFEFIAYAKKNGITDIYLSTNGMLLNDNLIRAIIESGLSRIQVSIDAFSHEIYEKVRPGGDLDRVVSNVNRIIMLKKDLNSITPLVRVNFVRTEMNEDELPAFIDYWYGKVDMIGVQEMVKPPVSNTDVKSRTTTNKRKEGFRCSFPFKQLVINNEGDILPCCTFYGEQLKLGNIKSDSIIEIWHSDKMVNLRKMHKNGDYLQNRVCRKCVEDALLKV